MTLRIIGGKYKGRQMEVPRGVGTRPTSDRLRETIFNVLDSRGLIQGAHVLDSFCGSGALGIEALSRGAAEATFIDSSPRVAKLVERNLASVGAEGRVMTCDLRYPPPAAATCNLVFMDPPYDSALAVPAIKALEIAGWYEDEAFILAETRTPFDPPEGYGMLDRRSQGKSMITLLGRGV